MPRLFLLLIAGSLGMADAAEDPSRVLEVHLFGGDVSPGAPLAPWYHDIGITDVWLFPGAGAFPQDQSPESQQTPEQYEANGVLKAYASAGIRYWWMERPVPDVLYQQAKTDTRNLWDSSPETDTIWDGICSAATVRYPALRTAGFTGLAFDNEAYYSFQGDESGREKPWVWKGHEDQLGVEGNYYKRGKQVGEAINRVWPRAKVILVYAFGYEGEIWWYRGFQDAGCEVFLGAEHTYGAGPGDFGNEYIHKWWGGKKTKETCDWKRTQFTFVADNQHVMAGLFPIDFNARKPNYRARDFREQLRSAACDDPKGPIPVWIWPQGPFTPQAWDDVVFPEGENASGYLVSLREFGKKSAIE
ncbi:MAG: hypothetical protein WC655_21500 [Candidatus Hydrogenedentales bacterium]|jgi:hypothetical protein